MYLHVHVLTCTCTYMYMYLHVLHKLCLTTEHYYVSAINCRAALLAPFREK